MNKIKNKVVYLINNFLYGTGLFYHDCKKNKVDIKDHPQFTWYCKKCEEPW